MSDRKTFAELSDRLYEVRKLLGLPTGSGMGRTYMHVKSGNHYIAWGVAFRESDMLIQVEYSPLTYPTVRFHRPWSEFQDRFRPVVLPNV